MNNAVAVMRISSDRQDIQGDSIEHQKDQIDRYAQARSVTIKKYFIFIESASKEQQPVQEAIDYCKNPKNRINLFIIKSIDRFTRGGSSLYDHMKTQLNKHNVRLIDIYGVINNQTVNTLEHLGVQYSWSVYNPSKKSELLEAERGKDELRDIMSRMIGAEVRYTRLGYRVRAAPIGYKNERIETPHGKRFILAPHPIESKWIIKMFELKVKGLLNDQEIVDQVNLMGFKSRRCYLRNPKDKNKIIGVKGENKLELKIFDRLIKNPIYAGITIERWTNYKPLKCQFDGLVSIEAFNQANSGKVMIFEEDGEIKFLKGKQLKKRIVSTARSLAYPYKRLIYCPECKKSFYGSASRGRSGKHFPAYHCSKKGHYHRIPLKIFHETVVSYLNNIRIKSEFAPQIQLLFTQNQEKKSQNSFEYTITIHERIQEINTTIKLLIEKIKLLYSEIAIRSLEEELVALENEKKDLSVKLSQIETQNMKNNSKEEVISNQLPQELINNHSMSSKEWLFKLLFAEIPTYTDLVNKTAILNREFEII